MRSKAARLSGGLFLFVLVLVFVGQWLVVVCLFVVCGFVVCCLAPFVEKQKIRIKVFVELAFA